MNNMFPKSFRMASSLVVLACIFSIFTGCNKSSQATALKDNTLYIYSPTQQGTPEAYDEAMAVACIQGLLNRDTPRLYIKSTYSKMPEFWLNKFSEEGGWMSKFVQEEVADFDALMKLGLNKVKGCIIWDPEVPATLNVATTLAGLKDAVVFSPEFAEKYQKAYKLKVIKDFRGMFTGSETGSAKNDAYRWAIKEFMDKGLCYTKRICLYEDSWQTRASGTTSYIVTRDWSIKDKCFVYDLSPWGDEQPEDDPNQKLGLDLETYKMLLESLLKQTKGKHATEVAGFFSFNKYSNIPPDHPGKHDPVPTEWENVYQISPYNCYQNTVAHDCFNQSVHSQAPKKNMTQGRPKLGTPENNKVYICILMADYDSTTPLYEFTYNRNIWNDEKRGEIPLIWGINPNLSETYPDIMQHLYETRTPNDWFGADASCAGYFNPNRIRPEYLQMFIDHNMKFYSEWDMSISPMVLDTNQPSDAVKDAFSQFSPDGYGTILINFQGHEDFAYPEPQVWNGMPIIELINDVCNDGNNPEATAQAMSKHMPKTSDPTPQYYFFRIIWVGPSKVINSINRLKEIRPDLDIEVIDPYNFFHYYKTTLENK